MEASSLHAAAREQSTVRAPRGRRARWITGRTSVPRWLEPRELSIEDGHRAARFETRRRDALNRRLLAIADMAAALVALSAGLVWLGDDRLTPAVLLVLPFVVAAYKITGLYDRDDQLLNKSTLDEAPSLLQAATIFTLALVFLDGFLVEGAIGDRQLAGVFALLVICGVGARMGARRLSRVLSVEERCLVLGSTEEADRLRSKLATSPNVRARIVGHMELAEGSGSAARLDRLKHALATECVHRVIVAPESTSSEEVVTAIQALKGLGVKVSILPRMFEVVGSSARFDELDGITLLGVNRFGLSRSSALVKRSLDLAGASLGLLFLGLPMLVAGLIVKVTSPGPMFFRQVRVGRDGELFEMVKFRSMYLDAEERKRDLIELNEAAEGLFKIEKDPRITPFGRLLRKAHMDEMPQLFNVLRGDMSLVGPRPLITEEDRRVVGWHRRRLHLKPGMTGHWQVLGSSRVPLREMVKIDYLYVANWSLWNDIKLLLRTVPHVVARRGM